MKLVVGNKRVTVQEKDVLGAGGEATVLRYNNRALKLYHCPNPTRLNKVRELIEFAPRLPSNVILPEELVWDERGKAPVGFAMRSLPNGYMPVSRLFQRAYRDSTHLNERDITGVFLEMQLTLLAIHAAGLVVGDFNDNNELFYNDKVQFIDVDSYQFGQYPCPVATRDYLDPQLYNRDLSANTLFSPANDWYSFAVMVFRALLLTHPYGGTHPTLKQLEARAQIGVTVFDRSVKYPKTALSPKLLTDELLQLFHSIFAKGWRGAIPVELLQLYQESLQECHSCGHWYPNARLHCPVCAATLAFVMPEVIEVNGLRCEEFLKVNGKLIFWQLLGDILYCLANEEGNTVLYTKAAGTPIKRQVLFHELPGARFEFAGNFLAVSPAIGDNSLLVIDLNGDHATGIARLTTDLYGSNTAIFACANGLLYRVAGGMLLKGEVRWGQLLERPVTSILENQTWFVAAPNPLPNQDRLIGYTRIFNRYEFFLLNREGRHNLEVALLQPGESLLETQAFFSGALVLLVRKTRHNGVTWIRFEVVDADGKIRHSRRGSNADFGGIDELSGIAFSQNTALLPTNAGILRVDLANGQNSLLPATAAYVGEGDALIPYGRGLLVVSNNRITFLKMVK
ncbi:MAG: hypothetical protein HXX08_19930 [Chloroflexi bacterium]|uniref:Protein kinase domain-containing protein n=1 Tax=Candidatus Chlorohelix allophototropha TaxID=3003348 RepID=A0A8T7M853_9CHLR|nr:hypothetical protein [Chloroflexota bacterium]WJW68071.1 hypothetical protein OZ401_003669 [Chloroflexota bacterium L227-S17]